MTVMATRAKREPGQGPVPARAATPGPAGPGQKLLLATDLSEASESATDEAFELAERLGASLLIVSVIDPGSLLLPGGRFRVRIDRSGSGASSRPRRSSNVAGTSGSTSRSSSGRATRAT